jgi:heme-degrading monooxygenase HmoA
MDNYFWVTTRTIKPGAREHFEHAWRPAEFPPGLVGAYVLYADERDEVVGISIWELEERSRFYTGRELGVPGR